MANYVIKLFQKYTHSILFSCLGLYITGWPLASARWYIAYLVGLVLVWTLPYNKKYQFLGYLTLVIGILAKAYVGYISPIINVKVIPIAMYEDTMIQNCKDIPDELTKILHQKFAEELDLSLKTPKINKPIIKEIQDYSLTRQPFLYDAMVNYGLLDHLHLWSLPFDIHRAFNYSAPLLLAINVEKADRGKIWFGDWQDNVFFEYDSVKGIKTHINSQDGITLKECIGHTFFMPFIFSTTKPSWVYIELAPLAVYIPLLLLLAAILMADIKEINSTFSEHIICLTIAFITICLADIWPKHIIPYANLHSIVNWIFKGTWDSQVGQASVWFVVNKLFYYTGNFGYLLPMLCFWASAWCMLQILKILLKEPYVYITWGIILTTPWLANKGMGLHIYHYWYMLYDSLMLGAPLFLFGLIGYMQKFKISHGFAWVAASLCNQVILAGVICLLIHKHLGRQRFIYLALTIALFVLVNINQLNALIVPMTINQIINVVKMSYHPAFIAIGLIPNILLTFSDNIVFRRFARMALFMHGGFVASTIVYQEAYLACTLSLICGFIYVEYLIEKFRKTIDLSILNPYKKLDRKL